MPKVPLKDEERLFPFQTSGWQSIGKTPEGRTLLQHPEFMHPSFGKMPAGVSSEITATVKNPFGEGYINIPTIYDGIPVSVEDALAIYKKKGNLVDPETGRELQVFKTPEIAVDAAKKRSASLISGGQSFPTGYVK